VLIKFKEFVLEIKYHFDKKEELIKRSNFYSFSKECLEMNNFCHLMVNLPTVPHLVQTKKVEN